MFSMHTVYIRCTGFKRPALDIPANFAPVKNPQFPSFFVILRGAVAGGMIFTRFIQLYTFKPHGI